MKKMLLVIILVFSFFILRYENIYAKTVIKLKECEYTEEYKKWVKLNKKEKSKYMVPTICKNTLNNYIIGSQSGIISEHRFDLREKNLVTSVKDQRQTKTCWAFATTAAMESNLLVNKFDEYDLSEAHMELSNQRTFPLNRLVPKREFNSGSGSMLTPVSYILNQHGPILEQDLEFNVLEELVDNETESYDVTNIENKKAKLDVNGVVYITNSGETCSKTATTTTQIKQYLVKHGAIATLMYWHDDLGLYTNNDGKNILKGKYLNEKYYYYNGTEKPNHAVTIVGWDDTISKDLFNENVHPSQDGAWIVKNSYGESKGFGGSGEYAEMGENGYFYVSYEDKNICLQSVGYVGSDDKTNDNVYYYDDLGWPISTFSDTEASELYAANVYDKKSNNYNEKIEKIMFASASIGMNYTVYFSENGELDNFKEIANGVTRYVGYENVVFENPIIISNDKFAVAIKYTAVENEIYFPLYTQIFGVDEYSDIEVYENSTYISPDMKHWGDTASKDSEMLFNTIIRVYTNNIAVNPDDNNNEEDNNDSENNNEEDNNDSENNNDIENNNKDNENKENENLVIPEFEPNDKNNGLSNINNNTKKEEENPSTKDISFGMSLLILALCFILVFIGKLKLSKFNR